MFDPLFFQFLFKPGGATPVGILPTVVGEHLLGYAVRADAPSIGLDNMLGRLAAIQPHCRDVASIIVQAANQVGIAPSQEEGHDVALPHLVRGGPFEKSRLRRILFGLSFGFFYQPFIRQGLVHARRAGRHQEKPLEEVADPAASMRWIFLSDCNDFLFDAFGLLAPGRLPNPGFQTFFPMLTIESGPAVNRIFTDLELLGQQRCLVTFLKIQAYHSQLEFFWKGR